MAVTPRTIDLTIKVDDTQAINALERIRWELHRRTVIGALTDCYELLAKRHAEGRAITDDELAAVRRVDALIAEPPPWMLSQEEPPG